VNLQTITRAKSFTRALAIILLFSTSVAHAGWKVDLSRRQKASREQEIKQEATKTSAPVEEKSFFNSVFTNDEPVQELVILNTEKGFVPSTVRMKKDGKYLVHVVNVNEKEKNVSFVLDAFSEHHATFYGKVRSFRVEPKREGIYSFQSPETSIEGRLIVVNPNGASAPAVRRFALRVQKGSNFHA
jgi:hypothetical protein